MMTDKPLLLAAIFLLTLASPASANHFRSALGTGNLSRIDFEIKVLNSSVVKGAFEQFSADIETADIRKLDQNTLISIVIESRTALGTGRKRTELLRSSGFLDSEKNPTIRFKSQKVLPRSNGTFEVLGELNIRGRVAPLRINVGAGKVIQNSRRTHSIVYSFDGSLMRSVWGMTWGAEKVGDHPLLEDEVHIEGEFEFYLND